MHDQGILSSYFFPGSSPQCFLLNSSHVFSIHLPKLSQNSLEDPLTPLKNPLKRWPKRPFSYAGECKHKEPMRKRCEGLCINEALKLPYPEKTSPQEDFGRNSRQRRLAGTRIGLTASYKPSGALRPPNSFKNSQKPII